jgi:hypothetical protein
MSYRRMVRMNVSIPVATSAIGVVNKETDACLTSFISRKFSIIARVRGARKHSSHSPEAFEGQGREL